MKAQFWNGKPIASALFAVTTIFFISNLQAQQLNDNQTVKTATQSTIKITTAAKINPTTIAVTFSNNQNILFDFYGENIFRLYQDNSGKAMRAPEAKQEAHILVDNPRKIISTLDINNQESELSISTASIAIIFDKNTSLFKIINSKTKAVIVEQTVLPVFEEKQVKLTLKENPKEYFYGGGVQNGRFSHKGKAIAIENQNSWTDGGVASPTPYYWSSNGYGIMWYTFKKGKYDFGAKAKGSVQLSHETDYLDVFFMINEPLTGLLNDFYQLTGNPVLLPKFGFYEGHLNAYNRDYWKESPKGILFEDGKTYSESQKDNTGIKESLNGEKNNYQFSARGVIDRYKKHDMPLGWILPNDGYGAGYGQTETLDGNIKNLKSFGEYARKNGIEIGLWTQSDLHPKEGISALLERDIIKEVRDAGVRVLKTDVAWVGEGYSFGLNGVADAGVVMPQYGNDARPFIISLDGWAGTQRYATIWSGDQTGGVWEYIRFHIPTYLGSGLSGQPNITSDVDGIFGGKNPIVNTRDFQWKTFTPMQLNMDGWGSNPKYPHALDEPVTSINRHYLKLKSELMPYAYSIAKEAVTGLPMIRPMFLESKNSFTQGKATQYQFMYGPNLLVAPIYQTTKSDDKGNDIRNGIYLPEGTWVDYFSGEKFQGNRVINEFDSPVWKLPVFVKSGAIIPMVNPNNNVGEIDTRLRIYEIYPDGKSLFTEYDDDGISEGYKAGKGTSTVIESEVKKNKVTITIQATTGDFNGFVKEKATELKINVTQEPKKITAKIGNRKFKLSKANSLADFQNKENVYFYNAAPNLNQFATKGSEFEKVIITKNPQILVKLALTNTTENAVTVEIKDFSFAPIDNYEVTTGPLTGVENAAVLESDSEPYTLKPSWNKVNNADFYEIEFDDMLYTTIKGTELLFNGLNAETNYSFKLRAVNKSGYSAWTTFDAKTKNNPLEFAIKGITATLNVPDQDGSGIEQLFDYDEANMWHTKWDINAIPFEMVIDLNTSNQIERFDYLPRMSGGNGNLRKGKVYYSIDKQDWIDAGTFEWKNNSEVKSFKFENQPTVRFIKIMVSEGVGNFGTGRELYVFKVPGTSSYLPGDINNDQLIDRNDLTSYINYIGLRQGDADFEGYVSNGDVNKNKLIDAYDVSTVATKIDGGISDTKIDNLAGKIVLTTAKQSYNKDEMIEVKVSGKDLKSVNALSFALPYGTRDFEFVGIQSLNTKKMENLTNDRLHSNGEKVLYPTFVNLGKQEALEGNSDLFIITFKAKQKVKFSLKPMQMMLVDKNLNALKM
ncbi:alpha-glucosidase (family GH31 glycosyl hydrolase) [Flavobacterium sp. PL11]|uniref:TIM-barrel domain-containing protein n=1 Tax=Flavobacterium sp. PL11 TaxID=3071717 RepID=UPI002E047AD8|nr:alpha-glucosidase (family GH31 glycosyl hydrolase) [Flavobacterium sp. PL11]